MAKTRQQYLADHNDDQSAALDAAVADAKNRESGNAKARVYRRIVEPALKALGIAVDLDADESEQTEAVTNAAQALVSGSKTGGKTSEVLSKVLAALKIDPAGDVDAQLKAVTDRTGELETQVATLQGENSSTKLGLSIQKAAAELGLNPALLENLKGIENLSTRKFKVKVTENGAEVEKEVDGWAIVGKDGDKETVKPFSDFIKPFESSLKTTTSTTSAEWIGAGASKPAASADGMDWLGGSAAKPATVLDVLAPKK